MQSLQKTVIDLVGIGLQGNADLVRQYAMSILRQPPASAEEEDFRKELSRLTMATPTTGLTRSVKRVSRKSNPIAHGIPVDQGTHQPLMIVDHPYQALSPILSSDVEMAVKQVVTERTNGQRLARIGISPTRSILLTGDPGTGKTMTSAYIASELDLPLVSMDLSTVMSSFLGRTGHNIREALNFARDMPCVLLLDEFDALAKRRDDPSDVGELKRIVNILLLEIERWPVHSLLIAATNHPELLDRAIWRRFDIVLNIELPPERERISILSRAFGEYNQLVPDSDLKLLAKITEGSSGSDIVRTVRESVRAVALENATSPQEAFQRNIVNRLLVNSSHSEAARVLCVGVMCTTLKMTQREVAAALGLSHVTIGKLLKKYQVDFQK